MLNKPQISWLDKILITKSAKSWWMVQYKNGKLLKEWDTVRFNSILSPLAHSKTSRWEDVDKKNMRGLYLVCPNGQVAALESGGDYQFFQLKSGIFMAGAGTTCMAHIIGKVDDDNGNCICYAWNYAEQKLERFEDNVTCMAYNNIGPLALDHVGIR